MSRPAVSIYGDISVDDIVKALQQVYPDKKLRVNEEQNKDKVLIHPSKIGTIIIINVILLL